MAKKKAASGKKAGAKGAAKKASGRRRSGTPALRMMEEMLREAFGGGLPGEAEDSPAGRARGLIEEAYEADGPGEQAAFARKALEIDPDNVEAHAIQGDLSRNPKEALDHYERAVAAGERALGARAFAEDAGHFWGLLETRPYMRARLSLAQCLWVLGRREEAVGHYRELLRLNPNDNQGVRYLLMPALIELRRDEDASALLEAYAEDGSAVWAYDRALLAFRRGGDSPESRRALTEARRENKHVLPYLTGEQIIPGHLPDAIGRGDRSEAVDYAVGHLGVWKDTPGAVAWLRGASPARKRKPKAPKARGALPLVKERMKRAPRRAGDVWQADARPLSTRTVGPGAPEMPWIAVVVSRAAGLILAQDVSEGPPSPDRLWDLLARAVEEPMMSRPHRPSTLQVRPGVGWEALEADGREVGIAWEVTDDLDLIDALLSEILSHLPDGEIPGLLDAPGVTPERASAFYDAAADFYRRAPWKSVGGEETIEVRAVGDAVGARYACVMGQMGMTRGLALYDDLATLSLIRGETLSDDEIAERTVALSVTFGDEEETSPSDVESARRLGWEVAAPDAYPSAFRKEFGPEMRPPDAAELTLLEAVLRALPAFLARREDRAPTPETFSVPTAVGETPVVLRWVDGTGR